uniref:DDE Tnp4 domain-containing protein n=1 Tax=Anopheles epiroticus TaxID=199890 RepID=A0A182PWL0_9DIPT
MFVDILEEITPRFPPIRGHGLSVKEMLAATLRFMAEGSYQHGVGTDFSVAIAQPTFSILFDKTLKILVEVLCGKWISLEMAPEEQQDARLHFYAKSGIPGIVMSVDGTHIKNIAPVQDRDQHHNRKGFYSLNGPLACDHKMTIRFVDATYSGANHDSHIWNVQDSFTQHGVGTDFSVAIAQPTFSIVFDKTLKILEEVLCGKWISLEMAPEEQQEARLHFYAKSGIPGIVMSVDGTHIKIIAPVHDRDQHYNRKGFYSLNALLVCDHKMTIRFVDARYSGANHDSHIWN